jgi:hypothetical protein
MAEMSTGRVVKGCEACDHSQSKNPRQDVDEIVRDHAGGTGVFAVRRPGEGQHRDRDAIQCRRGRPGVPGMHREVDTNRAEACQREEGDRAEQRRGARGQGTPERREPSPRRPSGRFCFLRQGMLSRR